MERSLKPLLGVVVLVLALGACSRQDPGTGTGDPPPATGGAPATGENPAPRPGRVELRQIAEVQNPTSLTVRKDDPALYVTEQTGRVRVIRDGKVADEPLVDLSGDVSTGSEQGLLGIAFSPDGRYLYLNFTDQGGHTHIREYAMSEDGRAGTWREVLTQRQPFENHNGGQLAFGPDGHLYIGLGDGGSGGDPQGNGQKLGTWLGKILRISPRPDGSKPYGVPRDNPFVGRAGARPEIWAYGLRNPWRFTFDSQTGDLWIGDVGQNAWEEVNRQPGRSQGGQNYGWNLREGRHPFNGGEKPEGAVDPVIEYPLREDGACSVIAGPVYRGPSVPGLDGHFLYGDFCAGWIKAAPVTADGVGPSREIGKVEELSSFGTDAEGNVYVLSLGGPVYRLEAR
ncbi:PQQ-dependent sugar dehydrogenase [Bailinhaonella thermotolerans]|uniref:Sugar dehydrogenase n=1 Tax=Bailinhaonella thermotolerans TaxID=1070861 RepID=A0A3A4B7E2_9ACTN|nr:PQQ-dependent sugar dehydrogenase [Bailinhaonella thermotolerans]RJL34141.1 sugar dehydrogenase [Bailinhaonella thermotolerans]